MAKGTKRSRPGRRLKRKSEAWFPLRRPALFAALGLAGWAPAGAAFPPTLNLSILDGTNGFRLNGVAAYDRSGSSAGDVNGDGLADLLIGAPYADPNGSVSGASYVVFGRDTAQTGPFPASFNLSTLNGTNGFRLNGVAAGDYSGFDAVSGTSYVVFGRDTAQTGPFPATSICPVSMARTAFA